MNFKKFTTKFILGFFVFYLVIYVAYILINPEQKFDYSITKFKFYYTKDYSRKQYEYLKKNKCVLIFGTSQIHMISTDMLGEKVLNFHNLYGEPDDIINFLYQLDSTQIKNISHVIYLIDLRAGATRKDYNLINYSDFIIPKLDINSLYRIYGDISQNFIQPIRSYLNNDGSIQYINSSEHIRIKHIPKYSRALLKFDQNLINKIVEINLFFKNNNININFITPVVNDQYIKSINFTTLSCFFSALINQGIDNIGIYYFIDGISNKKNIKGEYISFIEQEHLNPKYVKKWLFDYILKTNQYTISNIEELNEYIKWIKGVQKRLE